MLPKIFAMMSSDGGANSSGMTIVGSWFALNIPLTTVEYVPGRTILFI